MKKYYYKYNKYYYKSNKLEPEITDGGYVLAHNIEHAIEIIINFHRSENYPLFTIKDIICISDIPFINKKYYFNWYNYIAQQDQVDFVMAENLTEAKQMAVLIMQFFAGSRYTINDINSIDELTDSYFYTMDDIKERYEKSGKEFILPEIKDEDEDDE